ncbi:MAG: zinc dependent phospholipase C family protein [Clostridia bacterium]|nr:zinc dependent phospholipase C family protein [Clostridia bacterium]
MPASYTHYKIARETFKKLPPALQKDVRPFLSLYFFGAQGADFCFFYRFLTTRSRNLGSHLHRNGGYDSFTVLKTFSRHNAPIFAYALGYITHYAADSTFHPYVYATAGKSPLRHSRIESALDLHFQEKTELQDEYFQYFSKKLSSVEENELFLLYAAIAAKTNFPPLIRPSFSQAISLFNAYLPMPSALLKGNEKPFIAFAANTEKRFWRYPAAPMIVRNDNADELFEKSVLQSQRLIDSFVSAMQAQMSLPRALFGKNYLTGI